MALPVTWGSKGLACEGIEWVLSTLKRHGPSRSRRPEAAGRATSTHLHCLVLDGVYRCDADGSPTFIEADAPTGDTLQQVLSMIPGEQALACRHAIGHKVRGRVSEP
jgi:hypothetical protein